MNFKAFLGISKKAAEPEKPAADLLDRDEAEFEREVVFNELVKRGFNVKQQDWNLLTGMIEHRFSWGATIGGKEQSHDKWDFSYLDMNDAPPAEMSGMEEMTVEQLLRSMEALRDLAKRTAKK